MVDFWLTIGTMVADPRLKAAIDAAGPDVERVGLEFKFGDENEFKTNASLGAHLKKPTVAVRNEINQFFLANYPAFNVPASLYCAGKICSLMGRNRKEEIFRAAIANNQRAYAELTKDSKPALTQGFLSTLGLMMVDGVVRRKISLSDTQDVYRDMRFQPSKEQDAVLRSIADGIENPNAIDRDITGSKDWGNGCGGVYEFYPGFERAVY